MRDTDARNIKKLPLKILILAVMLVLFASAIKYREGDINYFDADASWHVLLTLEAYHETPKAQHLFLPLVSLGGPDDKWIPWGGALPDSQGNFYYASFSPASFFSAWLFMKLLRLPVSLKSLYLFNTTLFAASAALWGWLVWRVYEGRRCQALVAVIGVITFIFVPELLHGMGMVYWAQSLMQLTLLIQISAYYVMKKSDSRVSRGIFYGMAFINPYIEWTGYVANVGFALGELIFYWKEGKGRAFVKAGIVGVLTAFSSGVFVLHYLLRVDRAAFFGVLKSRFLARGVSSGITAADAFGEYTRSFLWMWFLLLVLFAWNIGERKRVELPEGLLMFVMAFPVLENLIMKEHAYYYSYDRMKGIFLFSFLICELSGRILEERESRRRAAILLCLTGVCGCLNLYSYKKDKSYIWEEAYLEDNRILAEYINREYPDSVLALDQLPVRGYMNLLFHRGIYEGIGAETAREQGENRGKRYAVVLEVEDIMYWNVYDLSGAFVYDLETGTMEHITVLDGRIEKKFMGAYEREDGSAASG